MCICVYASDLCPEHIHVQVDELLPPHLHVSIFWPTFYKVVTEEYYTAGSWRGMEKENRFLSSKLFMNKGRGIEINVAHMVWFFTKEGENKGWSHFVFLTC